MSPDVVLQDARFDLPSVEAFTPRIVSEHYGADRIAASYCGVQAPYPPPNGQWTHGWVPRYVSGDPDIGGEYLKLHALRRGREDFWTAVDDPIPLLRSLGWNARPIGMPIVYLPERPLPRRPRSLLVMPVHSLEWTTHDWRGEEYAEVIDHIRDRFDEVVVCVYPSCIENGYWIREFAAKGFPIVRGSHWSDANGLLRMQTLLSQFEFMTTNGFGSHIVYAAYFGARVSVYGPFPELHQEDMKEDQIYLPGNRHLELLLEAQAERVLRRQFPFLFCAPDLARPSAAWARDEVGQPHKIPPELMRELFHWRPAELRRWRLFGRHATRVKESVGAALPPTVKHWIKLGLSRGYRSRQRALARLSAEASRGDDVS